MTSIFSVPMLQLSIWFFNLSLSVLIFFQIIRIALLKVQIRKTRRAIEHLRPQFSPSPGNRADAPDTLKGGAQ